MRNGKGRIGTFVRIIAALVFGQTSILLSNIQFLNHQDDDKESHTMVTDKPFFVEISGASQLNQTQEEDVVEDALSTIVATLQEVNIRFYMYDHPNITMAGNKGFHRKRKPMLRFLNFEGANDKQMLEALKESPLRTYNTSEADLFIPPIPMASILASTDGNFHLPMQTLFEQEPFKKHQGNNHVLISTTFSLYRQNYRSYTVMKHWYHRMFNMTVVQSWDPVPYHNAIYHHKTLAYSFGQNKSTRDEKDKNNPLSRRSVSVGLGMNNKDMNLSFASVEKFHNSSNFIFYQSRTTPFFHNSTIYRHAPMNVTQDSGSFPKSCIGWGLDPETWNHEYKNSKFCLVVRGDSPHSKALWRIIRVGCIPVIASNHLPIYAPMFKSTLNMSDYAVIVDEEDLVNDPTMTLLKLNNMTEDEIRVKIMHLAFAQRVIFTDHPRSLFVSAFLKEATLAPEVL